MWLFKQEGRSKYLEFLRNLTPQILLLSFFLFFGVKLGGFTPDQFFLKIGAFVVLVCFAAMWVLAFAANGQLLYEAAIASEPKIEEHKSELVSSGVKGWRLTWGVFSFTCKNHLRLVFEVFIIVTIIYTSTILAIASSVVTSVGFLRSMT